MIDSKPIGFITVRTSSTRLPNKCLLPLGDDMGLEPRRVNCGIVAFHLLICIVGLQPVFPIARLVVTIRLLVQRRRPFQSRILLTLTGCAKLL